MTVVFNADEVFEIAKQIERNGAAFYRKAAETTEGDPQALLLDLADMEDGHLEIFTQMHQELTGSDAAPPAVDDPEHQAVRYLQAFAGGRVFDLRADPTEFLTQRPSLEAIFRKAIELERDSVMFYLGIREAMRRRLGADKIDEIIRQEMGHITLLNELLQAL